MASNHLRPTVHRQRMPNGASTKGEPPVAVPPNTAEDNPERGIQCYIKGCRAPVMHSWKIVFEHVRRFHKIKQSQMSPTFLCQAAREQIRKDDRRRFKLKHDFPLSYEEPVTVATKRPMAAPKPKVKGDSGCPSADKVAGTSPTFRAWFGTRLRNSTQKAST